MGIFFSDGWVLSQRQPWVGLEALLGPVPVIVEKLGPRFDVGLCYEDESGDIADHDHLGLTVGGEPGVVDQPP